MHYNQRHSKRKFCGEVWLLVLVLVASCPSSDHLVGAFYEFCWNTWRRRVILSGLILIRLVLHFCRNLLLYDWRAAQFFVLSIWLDLNVWCSEKEQRKSRDWSLVDSFFNEGRKRQISEWIDKSIWLIPAWSWISFSVIRTFFQIRSSILPTKLGLMIWFRECIFLLWYASFAIHDEPHMFQVFQLPRIKSHLFVFYACCHLKK